MLQWIGVGTHDAEWALTTDRPKNREPELAQVFVELHVLHDVPPHHRRPGRSVAQRKPPPAPRAALLSSGTDARLAYVPFLLGFERNKDLDRCRRSRRAGVGEQFEIGRAHV